MRTLTHMITRDIRVTHTLLTHRPPRLIQLQLLLLLLLLLVPRARRRRRLPREQAVRSVVDVAGDEAAVAAEAVVAVVRLAKALKVEPLQVPVPVVVAVAVVVVAAKDDEAGRVADAELRAAAELLVAAVVAMLPPMEADGEAPLLCLLHSPLLHRRWLELLRLRDIRCRRRSLRQRLPSE